MNIVDPNCQQFQGVLCVQCSNRYYKAANGLCAQVDPICQTYNLTTGVCTSCISGYVFIASSCIKTIANCVNYNSSGNCVSCTTGYTAYAGFCVSIPPNCQTFIGTTCTLCNSGYYLPTSGTCTLGNPNCTTYDSLGNCLSCINGFVNYANSCYKIPANCASYTGPTCNTCNSGYYLPTSGICTPGTVAKCASYSSTGACRGCVSGYTIIGTSKCVVTVANCSTYDPVSGSCTACNLGLFVSSGICISYTSINPNCTLF